MIAQYNCYGAISTNHAFERYTGQRGTTTYDSNGKTRLLWDTAELETVVTDRKTLRAPTGLENIWQKEISASVKALNIKCAFEDEELDTRDEEHELVILAGMTIPPDDQAHPNQHRRLQRRRIRARLIIFNMLGYNVETSSGAIGAFMLRATLATQRREAKDGLNDRCTRVWEESSMVDYESELGENLRDNDYTVQNFKSKKEYFAWVLKQVVNDVFPNISAYYFAAIYSRLPIAPEGWQRLDMPRYCFGEAYDSNAAVPNGIERDGFGILSVQIDEFIKTREANPPIIGPYSLIPLEELTISKDTNTVNNLPTLTWEEARTKWVKRQKKPTRGKSKSKGKAKPKTKAKFELKTSRNSEFTADSWPSPDFRG